jgi:type 1 glutamine amidotransferase
MTLRLRWFRLLGACLLTASVLTFTLLAVAGTNAGAEETRPTRLLLLAQGPDGHPGGTHEYRAGQRILKQLLSGVPNLEISLAEADPQWGAVGDPLANVDGVVLFISEGAKWIHASPRRQETFARFAERGGGLAGLHWAVGCKPQEPIAPFLKLLGACHGGPDRKYQVTETTLHPAPDHPVTEGLEPFKSRDEYYYKLKRTDDPKLVPLIEAELDGGRHMVAWGWERPDGGRSFGFTGLHFHANWSKPEYQRLVTQGVLWTLKRTPPEKDFPAKLTAEDLKLPERPADGR